ncbi:MAG: hypothetical protein JWQ34_2344 [Mucilaginibacter sp.]|uniref:hypothetical protein n=1 Tax=Mucilaginibacter sp. TaxID=1882438 RepID=UPI00260EB237|nr:hypothetical protein [Mucilaginibacter sp.]MDB5004119.1 hypothetical protein [Mucilaginibacter sp.]
MKALKITIAALILACTFQAASAQVSFGISFGTPLRRVYVEPYRPYPYYHEEVIERYPVRREVYYEPAPIREEYYEPAPAREVYYRRTYYRRQMYARGNHFGHEHFERRHR